LAAAREPETDLHRAQLDQVTIAQHPLLHPLTIDDGQRLRPRSKKESLAPLEGNLQMAFPNPGLVENESGPGLTTELKRKTADHDIMARLFARENLKLNHKLSARLEAARNPNIVARADRKVVPRILPGPIAINEFKLSIRTSDLNISPVGEFRKVTASSNGTQNGGLARVNHPRGRSHLSGHRIEPIARFHADDDVLVE